jgi:hypothetical protein
LIAVGREDIGRGLTCKNCGASIIVPGPTPQPRGEFDDLFLLEDAPDPPTQPNVAPAAPPKSAAPKDAAADEIWELMPDEVSDVAPSEPLADPLAVDENEPIRLDGVREPDLVLGQFRVKCPVCDSYIFATTAQVGQKLQCSDCFSMIPIVAPKTESAAPKAQPLDQSKTSNPEETIPTFPELDQDLPLADSDAEYGLAPPSDDLLKPRDDTLPPEILDLVKQSYSRPSPSGPSPSAQPPTYASLADDPVTKAKNLVERSPKIMPMTEADLPDVPPPPPPMQEVPLSEQFKWPEKFLVIFTDLNALQFLGFVGILLTLGYVIGDWGMGLVNFKDHPDSTIYPYRAFGAGVIVGAAALLVIAMFLAGIMINQLIEGAAYKRSLFHPPELGLMELLSSFMVVGVSFWAGMLPGIVLGNLFWSSTRVWWLTMLVSFGTAFFLAPIGILAAYYNGSAVQILSSEVLGTIRTRTAGWMRFYAWMALWVFLFCLSFLLLWIPPSLVGCTLTGFAQAACLVLIGRTIGLLAQAFINFWIEDGDIEKSQ